MHGSLLLHSRPPSAPAIRQGVACIIPTVVAVCLRRLSRRLAKARSHRLHGPARQSLRQRQDRELHEDTQGRSRVSDGVRNLRGRYSRPSPLHRRGLQHSQTPLRARLSEPRAIRGSPRPATCQNRRLKLSTIKGALHPTFRTRASRWPHAVFMPVTTRTVGRHPPSFFPGQQLEPGFGDVPTLSTRHQRFTCVRLASAHLTGSPRLFRNAHHLGHWTKAACGGLDPDPAIRARGTCPHLLCSKAASSWLSLLHGSLLFAPSWRTVIRISCLRLRCLGSTPPPRELGHRAEGRGRPGATDDSGSSLARCGRRPYGPARPKSGRAGWCDRSESPRP